ncbi:MAG TPA: hypothetical protein VHQ24_06640 [Lachnospiraceae bacterium]|nr:hypothetical protein [Lachnospiraceae bacterium]
MNKEGMNYTTKLAKVLGMAAIGALFGWGIGSMNELPFMAAYFGAGVPFGWNLVNKVIPINVIGFSIWALFFMVIKLGFAAIIGMFALPVLLIYYIFKIVQEKRSITL